MSSPIREWQIRTGTRVKLTIGVNSLPDDAVRPWRA
jgi:hypothetical protein